MFTIHIDCVFVFPTFYYYYYYFTFSTAARPINILPVQLNPFPLYPSIQTQQKLPGVLKQSAFISQLPAFSAHSSKSADSEKCIENRPIVDFTRRCFGNKMSGLWKH